MESPTAHPNSICLITYPYDKIYPGPKNLLHAFSAIRRNVFLISSRRVKISSTLPQVVLRPITIPLWFKRIPSLLRFFFIEIATLLQTLKIIRLTASIVIYQTNAILASILARLIKIKVVHFVGGSGFRSELSRATTAQVLRAYFLLVMERLGWKLANTIVIQSRSMIKEAGLEGFYDKLSMATNFPGPTFEKDFCYKTEFRKRNPIVGFVGRLEAEKGIIQFVKAIPKILHSHLNSLFLIIGDGTLFPWVKKQLHKNQIEKRVELTGFIPHEEVGAHLNKMRLLVLPSKTEGLPKIILEAQACGTPVLATEVGGIPEIIVNRRTGFLMGEASSTSITEVVTRLLNQPDLLLHVSQQALQQLTKYDFPSLVRQWKNILG